MLKVYIASPYTQGNIDDNVRVQIEMAHVLMDLGCAPYAPNLSHFLHLYKARTYEEWLSTDLTWVESCDVLLRLPGYSPGAEREVIHAKNMGIPVFYSIEELERFIDENQILLQ